jgi:RNA-directed DNA polymerase
VVDRVIQQAITQVLSPIFEKQFSDYQSKLIELLSRTIKDGRVISLIHKYLNAGVIENGMFARTEIGMSQGVPLSPLLSNIMLNELDKEIANRGHRFVRCADDCMIFCKSRKL